VSVNSHLIDVSSTLVLSETEKDSISTSITTLATRLNSYFETGIVNQFRFGSSVRGTILPRSVDSNSDIDYMVVFPSDSQVYKPQTYLNRLKSFVEYRYSTSEIFQSHPTIVLSLSHIKFELVPALSTWSGYNIPSPSNYLFDWIETAPFAFNEKVNDANKKYDYKIKPLIRLVKYWNVLKSKPFTSYSLEDYIAGQFFFGCNSLRDYFYQFWADFTVNSSWSQSTQNKVTSAKKAVEEIKQLEIDGYPLTAENKISKLLPKL